MQNYFEKIKTANIFCKKNVKESSFSIRLFYVFCHFVEGCEVKKLKPKQSEGPAEIVDPEELRDETK